MGDKSITLTPSLNSLTSLNHQNYHHHDSPISLEGLEIKDSPFKLIDGRSLAAGSFGKVYRTRNVKTNEMVVTKLVRKDNPNAKLKNEYEWYRILGPLPGLPKVYFFGECGPYDAMVMELLGPSLEQVFITNNSRFSLRTTTQIAIMILEIMRYIHSKKMIFCNVKPENFCLGPPNTPQANQVYMIGLINAKRFETQDSEHIPKILENKERKQFGVFGTPRYMSLNAHKGKELSRRDDLESIGYMLLYFIHGKLPWQGLPNNSGQHGEKYEHIYITKKLIHLDELCANLPSEYYHYMLYVRTLKFAQEPNYKYLITMFTRLLYRINMDQSRELAAIIPLSNWPNMEQQSSYSNSNNSIVNNNNSNKKSQNNNNNSGNNQSDSSHCQKLSNGGQSSSPSPSPPSSSSSSSLTLSKTSTAVSSLNSNNNQLSKKQVSFKIDHEKINDV